MVADSRDLAYATNCDINLDAAVSVSDVQLIINEALGVTAAVHDLNHNGVVNVVDVQKVINAALVGLYAALIRKIR